MSTSGPTGEFSRLELGAAFWGGLALFSAGTLIAAFAPGRRIVGATLVILLAYHGYQIGRAVLAIVAAGGWSVLGLTEAWATPSQEAPNPL